MTDRKDDRELFSKANSNSVAAYFGYNLKDLDAEKEGSKA